MKGMDKTSPATAENASGQTAGEPFVVPDIGGEGCECEWEMLDYFAPAIFRPCAFHADPNWAVSP